MARRTEFTISTDDLNRVFNACAAASLIGEVIGVKTPALDRVVAILSDAVSESTGVEVVVQVIPDGDDDTTPGRPALRSIPAEGRDD